MVNTLRSIHCDPIFGRLAPTERSADNRAVPASPWQKRIARAEELAVQHPFAAEILTFYAHLARFQESLYQPGGPALEFSDPLHADRMLAGSAEFLRLVEDHGPARLADVALRLRANGLQGEWPDLLNTVWSTADYSLSEPQDFLARAFLQPRAEWIRCQLASRQSDSSGRLCPFCGRKPVAGVLRQQGDGASRSLLCSLCLGEWEFRRIACPKCGEENNRKLSVYTAAEFPAVRVDCCDSCKTYIKTVDLTRTGLAVPVVDEIAFAPLDLWAQEHAYRKLHPNLLGL